MHVSCQAAEVIKCDTTSEGALEVALKLFSFFSGYTVRMLRMLMFVMLPPVVELQPEKCSCTTLWCSSEA